MLCHGVWNTLIGVSERKRMMNATHLPKHIRRIKRAFAGELLQPLNISFFDAPSFLQNVRRRCLLYPT